MTATFSDTRRVHVYEVRHYEGYDYADVKSCGGASSDAEAIHRSCSVTPTGTAVSWPMNALQKRADEVKDPEPASKSGLKGSLAAGAA